MSNGYRTTIWPENLREQEEVGLWMIIGTVMTLLAVKILNNIELSRKKWVKKKE